MELTIKGTPKEIADLVVAIQGQQQKVKAGEPLSTISKSLQSVIHEASRGNF